VKLEIRHVRLLIALAEERSIRRTAQRLGLPQPALSSQLSRIERTIGRKLFDRNVNGIVLTDHGRGLLQHMQAVDTGMRALERESADARRPPSVTVSVGVPWVSLLTELERQSEPAVRLAVIEGDGGREALLRGALDFLQTAEALDARTRLPQSFRAMTVVDLPVGVVVPPRHPLFRHDRVAEEELAGERWLSSLQDNQWHQALLDFGAALGFTPDVQYLAASRAALPELLDERPVLALGNAVHAAAVGGRLLRFGHEAAERVITAWDPLTCPPELARKLTVSIRDWYQGQVAAVRVTTAR